MTETPDYRTVKAWPFEEAAKIAARLAKAGKREALFETGYGPSGLPHIGTFGEVARTSWVRHAFQRLYPDIKTRLIAFSDDMDGLRKVPDNVPNGDLLRGALGMPLTAVPDPFGTHSSFGAHNNARLCAFLDSFGFEYEFVSATDYYKAGKFDAVLKRVLERYDAIMAVMLPTLGEERQSTYSPILPIHPRTGHVMMVPIIERKLDAHTVVWKDPASGETFETPVTGGHCKLQWKADWAMRWVALDVDYEMNGKDLIPTRVLSGQIADILGGSMPEGFNYELFLDDKGQKISKSKGNGLSVEEWLTYAPPESLGLFMYGSPQRAKRLFFDVIPKATDEYLAHTEKLAVTNDPANPAWHIHNGALPNHGGSPVSFTMLLNIASVANADNADILWGFLRRYVPDASPEAMPFLAGLVDRAVLYYRDFVKPAKKFRAPSAVERAALEDLSATLAKIADGTDAATLQNDVFEVGKRHFAKEALRDWFGCLYQVLLGQQEGPRFGGFVALYGVSNTVKLINDALARTAGAEA